MRVINKETIVLVSGDVISRKGKEVYLNSFQITNTEVELPHKKGISKHYRIHLVMSWNVSNQISDINKAISFLFKEDSFNISHPKRLKIRRSKFPRKMDSSYYLPY